MRFLQLLFVTLSFQFLMDLQELKSRSIIHICILTLACYTMQKTKIEIKTGTDMQMDASLYTAVLVILAKTRTKIAMITYMVLMLCLNQ